MQNVYTVAQVNAYIKNMFTQDFMMQSIFVKGEVSNCKYHSSGHIYFTLKDEKGSMACVMFAGNRTGLKFRLEEGQQVIVFGTIDVYERDGKYQMYAKQIALDGAGVLYERFERLKEELEELGMFAPEYKQPIPRFVRKLGVVTAPTGAAVQDIINIVTRRNPYVQIILYPAIVQGDQAAPSVVNGGGSIEDLWAFNERTVAQAVFDCSVPIISAVGHETDTTIIDYVSDLRAPTPSAAAELAVYDVNQFLLTLDDCEDELVRCMENRLDAARMQYRNLELQLRHASPQGKLAEQKNRIQQWEQRLRTGMERKLTISRHEWEVYLEKLKGLSPLDKLKQGYSYSTYGEGKTLKDITDVKPGDAICVYVGNGCIDAVVQETRSMEWEESLDGRNESGRDL